MSMGPLSLIGSLAGTPLAQSKGAEIDRAKSDTAQQQRKTDATERADAAAGIGRTHEDAETGDRDADGRRVWELSATHQRQPSDEAESAPPPLSKDPTGQAGNVLDLSG